VTLVQRAAFSFNIAELENIRDERVYFMQQKRTPDEQKGNF
jgi:hypothetical protein